MRNFKKKIEKSVITMVFLLSCIKDNETLGSLFIHDPVATFSTPDGISGTNLVLTEI